VSTTKSSARAAARQRANMTQQELARRFGKPQSVVSEFERMYSPAQPL